MTDVIHMFSKGILVDSSPFNVNQISTMFQVQITTIRALTMKDEN